MNPVILIRVIQLSLDCVPCFVRQSLEAVRMISSDRSVHESTPCEVLHWASKMDFDDSPPVKVQRIHMRLREITGADDPYCEIKKQHNRMALNLFPELQCRIAGWDPGCFMFQQRKFF